MATKYGELIVAPKGERKRCYKTITVGGGLRNYNKYKEAGWEVHSSGDGQFTFRKRVMCSKRRK